MEKIPITEAGVRDYLDKAIIYWSSIHNNHFDTETKNMAKHYTDALQSMRAALLGSALVGYMTDPNAKLPVIQNPDLSDVDVLVDGATNAIRSSIINLVKHPVLYNYGMMGVSAYEWVLLAKGLVLLKAPHLRHTVDKIPSGGKVSSEDLHQITQTLFSVIGTPEELYKQWQGER